jgi:hypothetical protein
VLKSTKGEGSTRDPKSTPLKKFSPPPHKRMKYMVWIFGHICPYGFGLIIVGFVLVNLVHI